MPEEIKKKMKDVPEDWSEYIRKAIEERIDMEERKRILRDMKELSDNHIEKNFRVIINEP